MDLFNFKKELEGWTIIDSYWIESPTADHQLVFELSKESLTKKVIFNVNDYGVFLLD